MSFIDASFSLGMSFMKTRFSFRLEMSFLQKLGLG